MTTRLFARLLGHTFDGLPEACRAMHTLVPASSARGFAEIARGRNPLARWVGAIAGMPPAGRSVPLTVSFKPYSRSDESKSVESPSGESRIAESRIAESPIAESWTRNFDGHVFESRLSQDGPLLRESLFPLVLWFKLEANADGVCWSLQRTRVLNVLPLPGLFAPRVEAREWSEQGRYHFLASASLPLIGLIVRYQGSLDAPQVDSR